MYQLMLNWREAHLLMMLVGVGSRTILHGTADEEKLREERALLVAYEKDFAALGKSLQTLTDALKKI
jgi:hypothetical protein